MDLWRGHIGAAALFDWTQNPDVLALLASGLCATGRDHSITTVRIENTSSDCDIPFSFATPHVSCAHFVFSTFGLLGPRPDRIGVR